MLSRVVVLLLFRFFVATGPSSAGELGVIPRPLFEALNALRASQSVPTAVVDEEFRRLGQAYRELGGLHGTIEMAGGLPQMMSRLGTRYGELLEEQAGLLKKLQAARGAAGAAPYRNGTGGDEARLERVNGELRMTLEKALLIPYFLRPEKISSAQLEARSRSERVSLLTLVGGLFATGAAAGLADMAVLGHDSLALQSWAVATAVFFGMAGLKPGSLREWLVVKPALRAMHKAFVRERDALFEAFTESASAASEISRTVSAEVGAGYDFVTRGLTEATIKTRVCEFEALNPEQRVRVELESELEGELEAVPAVKRARR